MLQIPVCVCVCVCITGPLRIKHRKALLCTPFSRIFEENIAWIRPVRGRVSTHWWEGNSGHSQTCLSALPRHSIVKIIFRSTLLLFRSDPFYSLWGRPCRVACTHKLMQNNNVRAVAEPVKRTIFGVARSFPVHIAIRQILILVPFSVSLFCPFLPHSQNCNLIIHCLFNDAKSIAGHTASKWWIIGTNATVKRRERKPLRPEVISLHGNRWTE